MNPSDFFKMINGIKNPKEMAMKMLGQSTNNPILTNLIEMANNGDTKGVENFARNYMKSQGMNYDEEFNKFKDMFNNK